MIQFRVQVVRPDGIPVVIECFETESDCNAFCTDLLGPDSVLNAIGGQALLMTREEFFKGTWVTVYRKLIDMRE